MVGGWWLVVTIFFEFDSVSAYAQLPACLQEVEEVVLAQEFKTVTTKRSPSLVAMTNERCVSCYCHLAQGCTQSWINAIFL